MESVIMILGFWTLGTWFVTRLLGPFSTALARRLVEGRRQSTADFDPSELQREMEALHERIDFLERALVNRAADLSSGGLLAPPEKGREDDQRLATPV